MTLIATLCGFFGEVFWILDLMCHFRVQYFVLAAICAGALLLFRDYRWSAIAFVAAVMNGCLVLPWYFGAPEIKPRTSDTFRLLLSNVLTANRDSAAVLKRIYVENPDVVVLQEIDDRWMDELERLQPLLPHRAAVPRSDNFGIGLWSKREPIQLTHFTLGETEVPNILAKFEWKGADITILATHPLPPTRRETFNQRNEQLALAAALARQSSGHFVLIGDLNVTMWSPYYSKLIRASGLRNARKGFGVLPTWPTNLPGFEIPLDQCLISRGIKVSNVRTAKPVGSDHLPLISRFVARMITG
jgi:endonuclease/exonuclease/phosphatase (EEP) superfamily protein YafD